MKGMMTFVRYWHLARDVSMAHLPSGIDVVVGVPRSGMLPATMIATRLHVPLGMAGGREAFGGSRLVGKKWDNGTILLVDDSVLTGRSMARAKQMVMKMGVPEKRVITFAMYAHPECKDMPDHIGYMVPGPRVFEWNMWNSQMTRHLMVDMDGVLCFDPEVFDDDGPKYENEIVNATPRFIPKTYPVKRIVTNRIERWRDVTERWLDGQEAQHGGIEMQPHGTASERRAARDTVAFKAKHYMDSDALLFVESHDRIAHPLSQASKRPVLSLESNRIFSEAS